MYVAKLHKNWLIDCHNNNWNCCLAFNKIYLLWLQVMERMANNLEVAGRQRTTVNGRTARLRSALELLNMVNPNNVNCIMQVARFYMQYNLNVSALRQALEHNIQVYYLIKFLFLTFIYPIYLFNRLAKCWLVPHVRGLLFCLLECRHTK